MEVIVVYLGWAGIIFDLSCECDSSTFASKIVIVLDHTLQTLTFVVWVNKYLIRLICADIPGALALEIEIFTCTLWRYRKFNILNFFMSTQ